MSGPVFVTLQSSPPGLMIHTLIADSGKMLDPTHCLHWFLWRLCSYMLAPPVLHCLSFVKLGAKSSETVIIMHSTQEKNKTIYPKKKTVLRYVYMLSPKKWYNWKVEKKCTNWAIVWKWAPRHLLFEAVYLKQRDYSAGITRSEALPTITRPTAWTIWHNQSTQL